MGKEKAHLQSMKLQMGFSGFFTLPTATMQALKTWFKMTYSIYYIFTSSSCQPEIPARPEMTAEIGVNNIMSMNSPFYERIHYGRIGKRRRIPKVFQLVMGDLPQNTPHDLAASRFR